LTPSSPPRALRPCFMPVALMGFCPSRAFPSARSRSASRRPQPSLRWPRGPRQARPDEVVHQSPRTRGGVSSTGSARPVPLGPHSGPGTSTESVARHRGLAGGRARCSPGVSTSPGHHASPAFGAGSRLSVPPMGLAIPPFTTFATRRARQEGAPSESRSARWRTHRLSPVRRPS
jgi:hypothetical protein